MYRRKSADSTPAEAISWRSRSSNSRAMSARSCAEKYGPWRRVLSACTPQSRLTCFSWYRSGAIVGVRRAERVCAGATRTSPKHGPTRAFASPPGQRGPSVPGPFELGSARFKVGGASRATTPRAGRDEFDATSTMSPTYQHADGTVTRAPQGSLQVIFGTHARVFPRPSSSDSTRRAPLPSRPSPGDATASTLP